MHFAFFGQILLEFEVGGHGYDFVVLVEVDLNRGRGTKLRKVVGPIVPSARSSFCHSRVSMVLLSMKV
jgi:hypothetical protein